MRPTPALGSLAVLFAVAVGVGLLATPRPPERRVKLAVLVVFDQMRGDYLERWRPLFGPDGFARLQRDGAWFTHCHYPYGVTTTGPGHASMLTGACADVHGIVNNSWVEARVEAYCAGDSRYHFVPGTKPAKAKNAGTPERLRSETVADVLKEVHGAKAKVFGLSLKDRSAILPTGRRPDGAYWFEGGTFGTSTYYADRVHPWVERFNGSKFADQWKGKDWTRFRPDIDYTLWSGPDDVRGEGVGAAQGVTFPHPTTRDAKYYEAVVCSPFGNDLLLQLAKTCVSAERLGTRDAPDLLVVSFSSNDLIGHTWGPDSHEVLDVTLRSDALMAELLAFLDAKVGKGRYLLGLTADHGVCPLPEVSAASGVAPDAKRVKGTDLKARIDKHLTEKFRSPKQADGKDSNWAESIIFPWVRLNQALIDLSGRTRAEIATEAARCLTEEPKLNVMRTFTQAELAGTFPDSDVIANRMKRSFDPSRCGDLAVVLEPYSIPAGLAATHGAPFDYDTHVPLLVYGPGIRGGERSEPTTPQALASIFAKWLEVRRPKDAAFPVPATLE